MRNIWKKGSKKECLWLFCPIRVWHFPSWKGKQPCEGHPALLLWYPRLSCSHQGYGWKTEEYPTWENVCFHYFPLTYLHLPLIKPNAQVQATHHQPYDEISLRLMWLTPNSNSLRFLSLKRTAVLSGPKLQFRWSVIIKFQCWNRSTVNINPSASLQLTSVHFRHMAGRGPVLNCT